MTTEIKWIKFSDKFPETGKRITVVEVIGETICLYHDAHYEERSKKDYEECYIYYNDDSQFISTYKYSLKSEEYYWMDGEEFDEFLAESIKKSIKTCNC